MSPDVVIVGAGVIGCAIARALALAQLGRILVVDRGEPGAEASGAAAGLLAVASSRAPGGAIFELRRLSAAMFPELVEDLRAESAIAVEYSTGGLLDLAFTAAEAEALARLVERRRGQGFDAELVDRAALGEIEPCVNSRVRSAAWFAGDRVIDSRAFVAALHAAARRRGVEFRFGAPVEQIEIEGSRVRAVVAGGERVTPGHVVVAAGLGSADLGALLGVKVPVRPDRGEMLALRPAVPLRRALSWNDGYLVPRADGEVLVGSTSARGATVKEVTAGAVAALLERAVRMVPDLAVAPVTRFWAGIRPMSTLRRPIIGPLRGFENVTLATGHHRSGILLAPITAKLVAELLRGGETTLPMRPYSYRPR